MNNVYRFARRLFPNYYHWCIPNDKKEIYLSFDDGPTQELTDKILTILARKNVKATFFLVGENVKKFPQLYNSIISNGHVVGNHTFNHFKGWLVASDVYLDNIRKASDFIKSNLFRPPYGKISIQQAKLVKSEYKIIMWSLLTRDYDSKITPEKCFQISKKVKSGDIIVFHDNIKAQKNMLFALPLFLDFAIENGYTFKTL